jgi:hypothetical protein
VIFQPLPLPMKYNRTSKTPERNHLLQQCIRF